MKLTFVSFLSSLAVAFGQHNPLVCINTSDFAADFDFFPHKVNATISEYWDIQYFPTYKILRNELQAYDYVLYQCGTAPPTLNLTDTTTTMVAVPLQSGCGITSTTAIPFLELLGARTQMKAWLGDAFGTDYISSSCVKQLLSDGEFLIVPDPSNSSSPGVLALLALNGSGQDLVAFSDSDTLFSDVSISESSETTSLGILEWIKFYSAFFNLEAIANQVFGDVAARYDCVIGNAQATSATDSQNKPIAVWAYYSNYSGENGFDVAECPNYYCDYADACSATLLNSREGSIIINNTYGGPPFVYMNITEFVEFAKGADHWFYPSDNWDIAYKAFKNEFAALPSVQNQRVFDNLRNGGIDSWFENRLAQPDVVLQDFCDVVGTGSGIHVRVWFRNVFTESIDALGQCENVTAPLESMATECVVMTDVKPVAVPTPAPVSAASSISLVGILAALLFAALF